MPPVRRLRIIVLLFCLLLGSPMLIATAVSGESDRPPSGKQVFETKCLHCHKASKFVDLHYDRRAWEQIVRRMELNTCVLTDAEYDAVCDFLVQEHGE